MSSHHRCCWPTADPRVAPLSAALFQQRGDEMARRPVDRAGGDQIRPESGRTWDRS